MPYNHVLVFVTLMWFLFKYYKILLKYEKNIKQFPAYIFLRRGISICEIKWFVVNISLWEKNSILSFWKVVERIKIDVY